MMNSNPNSHSNSHSNLHSYHDAPDADDALDNLADRTALQQGKTAQQADDRDEKLRVLVTIGGLLIAFLFVVFVLPWGWNSFMQGTQPAGYTSPPDNGPVTPVQTAPISNTSPNSSNSDNSDVAPGLILMGDVQSGVPEGTNLYTKTGLFFGTVKGYDSAHQFPNGTNTIGISVLKPGDDEPQWMYEEVVASSYYVKR